MEMETYGPPLPPGFMLPKNGDSDSNDEQPKKKSKVIGPERPSFVSDESGKSMSPKSKDESRKSENIGPVLPGTCFKNRISDDDDEDNEVYGPLPPETKLDYNVVNLIEKRATNMKNKLEQKDAPVVHSSQREEWMTVPDTSRRNQLGAISRCLAPGSEIKKKETDSYQNPEENAKTTEELKKYNKSKRGESLLDLHRKKKKKEKKEKKAEKKERKAFDREEMAVRHFSKDQVNSVIDKAKYLNSRFAPGKSQQYL